MAAEVTLTPLDVAVEFVATKVALASVLDSLHGTSPSNISGALRDWAYASPVPLPLDADGYLFEAEFGERFNARVAEIEADMLEAVAAFTANRAAHMRRYAEECAALLEGGDDA